jgi:multidrug efflux pump subunit AcrA (membrane-fusion protein)
VNLEQAQRDLERTRIFTPCDGTVVTENVEQDGYAQAGATMVVMNDTSAAEVACQLEFDDMFWLWGTHSLEARERSSATTAYEFPRWPVTVSFPIQDLVCEWQGELIRYGGTGVDPATRTIPCQVHVPEPQHGSLRHLDGSAEQTLLPPPLTVGMFVSVRAKLRPHTPLLKLPADALRAGSAVWRFADGQLHTVPVKLARRLQNDVLVYGQPDQAVSLQPGDRIVTSPLALVQEGMAVQEAAIP